jgi:hypothetical protein
VPMHSVTTTASHSKRRTAYPVSPACNAQLTANRGMLSGRSPSVCSFFNPHPDPNVDPECDLVKACDRDPTNDCALWRPCHDFPKTRFQAECDAWDKSNCYQWPKDPKYWRQCVELPTGPGWVNQSPECAAYKTNCKGKPCGFTLSLDPCK